MMSRKNMLIVLFVMAMGLFAWNALAAMPRFNIDPYSHHYTADQSFAGGISVSGDVVMSGDFSSDEVTCEVYQSALSSGNDDMVFKPAGTLAMTLAESTGNMTLVGDLIVSGNDVTAANMQTAATGGADDMTLKPAGVVNFTVTEAGAIMINKVVTAHGACAAAGDRGRMEIYDDGANHVSICACEQTGAATYAWKALSGTGVCT